jgi:hypothetical protein
VLQPSGEPWGWSTPLTAARSVGPFAEVVTASGLARYTVDEDVTGQTSCGRIYQIETTTQDAGGAITSKLWTARDLADSLKRKAVQELNLVYKIDGDGIVLTGYRDGLGSVADATLTIPTTGATATFAATPLPMPQAMRSATRSLEFLVADDGGDSDAPQIWGIEADLLLVDTYT